MPSRRERRRERRHRRLWHLAKSRFSPRSVRRTPSSFLCTDRRLLCRRLDLGQGCEICRCPPPRPAPTLPSQPWWHSLRRSSPGHTSVTRDMPAPAAAPATSSRLQHRRHRAKLQHRCWTTPPSPGLAATGSTRARHQEPRRSRVPHMEQPPRAAEILGRERREEAPPPPCRPCFTRRRC